MNRLTSQELYARLYDLYVRDWPGEWEFYRELAADPLIQAHGLLEIACGTGRISLRLAETGVQVTGLDLSGELLERAREKSGQRENLCWVQGDMRTFELEDGFGGVIIPGHSFQFMNTPEDQIRCLEQVRRHLVEDGILVVHVDHDDLEWLGALHKQKEPVYEKGAILIDPKTGCKFRMVHAWTLERSTQAATVHITWEEIGEDGNVVQTWEMDPMRLHYAFRFEMVHLFLRAGFAIEAVYGDFFKNPLADRSEQMVWVVKKNQV
jgi:SAM-dependent methyltransferase